MGIEGLMSDEIEVGLIASRVKSGRSNRNNGISWNCTRGSKHKLTTSREPLPHHIPQSPHYIDQLLHFPPFSSQLVPYTSILITHRVELGSNLDQ